MTINAALSLLIYFYYFGYTDQSIYSAIGIRSINVPLMLISIIIGIIQSVMCYSNMGVSDEKTTLSLYESDKIYLIIIIAMAFLLRVVGYDWGGEASTFQPDEGKVFYPGMRMAVVKTMMSDQVNYPSHISHKVLSLIYGVYISLDGVAGIEYTELGCNYLARIYIAIVSTFIVLLVYYIGNAMRFHSGKYAALLVALFPPFISAAHCVTGDPVVALCCCIAILLGLKYYDVSEKRGMRYLTGMSLCAAIATLEKYHGMVICGLIAIVVLSKEYNNRKNYFLRILREGIFSAVAYVVFLAMISPNLIFGGLDNVYDQIFLLTNEYESGVTFIENILRYMSWFFSHIGIMSTVFIIVGIYAFIKNKNKKAILLIIGVLELIGVSIQNRGFIRWGYPFYLCVLLTISVGIVEVKEFVHGRKLSYKCVIWVLEMAMIVNLIAGAILTETLYLKCNMDTKNVSERWFLELGIGPDDCIQTRYTCWNPGGINSYENVITTNIKNSLMMIDEQCYVKRLGKKYAVNNQDRFSIPEEYLPFFTLAKKFEAGYRQSMLSFGWYDKFSLKIFEPYSIYEAINVSANLIMDRITTGQDMYIYDISEIPAYAEFSCKDFEVNIIENGQREYCLRLPAILCGEYTLKLNQNLRDVHLLILDADNDVIVDERKEENDIIFKIQEDSKNLYMKLIIPQENLFDTLNIIQTKQ